MPNEGSRLSRLYTPESLTPVIKFAGDYSPEEQRHFREAFRPMAEHYRRYSSWAFIIGVTAFVLWMGAIQFFPRVGLGWVCAVMFLGLLGLVVFGLYARPLLECPACHNLVDSKQFGRYCPECGSDQLKPGTWPLPPRCSACGKRMHRGKSRGYKIRACTHCGVLLDEKGV